MNINQIEEKIRALVEKTQRLESENAKLKTLCQSLEDKTLKAVRGVEGVIAKLKVMEEQMA